MGSLGALVGPMPEATDRPGRFLPRCTGPASRGHTRWLDRQISAGVTDGRPLELIATVRTVRPLPRNVATRGWGAGGTGATLATDGESQEEYTLRIRTHRIRRVGAAALLGMGMTAGVIGLTAGVAGAATVTGTATASNATSVSGTTTTAAAGTITITFATAATTVAGKLKLTLTSGATWKAGTVAFTGSHGTATLAASTTTSGTAKATITLGAGSITAGEKIKVTGVKIATSNMSHGTAIKATAADTTSTGATTLAATGSPTIATVAASTNTNDSITASTKPTVASTGSLQTAGSLTVTLRGTATTAGTTTHVDLSVAPAGGTSVHWASASVSSSGVAVTQPTVTGTSSTLTIKIGHLAATASATLTVSGVRYNTTNAEGTITVTPHWTKTAANSGLTEGTFTPSSAVNAVSSAGVPAVATTITVDAASVPAIGVGTSSGTAGSEVVTITGATGNSTEGWTAGGSLTLTAARTGTCNAIGKYLAFAATPTVTYTATGSKGVSATPKVTASLKSVSPCTASGRDNELKLTFTNSVTLKHTGSNAGYAKFVISGIKYAVGTTDTHGVVAVTPATSTNFSANHPTPTGTPDNADVSYAYLTATSATLTAGSLDHAITTVKITEAKGKTVPTGYVCLTLANTGGSASTFDTTASATVTTTGGATAKKTVTYTNTGKTAKFDVTKQSTATKPSTFAVSGLAIDATTTTGKTVTLTARDGEATTCTATGTTDLLTTAVAHTKAPNTQDVAATSVQSTEVYGSTADATAAAELDKSYTHTGGTTTCAGYYTTTGTAKSTHAVVLARDTYFSDALASQDLAKYLDSGTLLTPSGTLSTATINALRVQGIQTVYVVGGPDAIKTSVVDQLRTLDAYNCGGKTLVTSNTKPVTLSVIRLYGQTEYGTAKAVAERIGKAGSIDAAGAYASVNTTGGEGMYNATAGTASTHPNFAGNQTTVILATGKTWYDAESASALSYETSTPIILTTSKKLTGTAETAISYLGAKQVIVMGGQDAVSNTVTKTLMTTLKVAVLRVAGVTYTDTAVELAKFEESTTTGNVGLGWKTTSNKLMVARGDFYTDGLAGAVLENSEAKTPLVLTVNPTTVGTYLTAFLKSAQTSYGVTSLTILGGPEALQPATVSQMQTDLQH